MTLTNQIFSEVRSLGDYLYFYHTTDLINMVTVNGRPTDPVRQFFEKGDGSKDRCLACGTMVSNKTLDIIRENSLSGNWNAFW